jgi:hypothetical protein
MSHRLINERPLIVLPSLVALFDGDYTRAILVQQIHFLSQIRDGIERGGHTWIRFTYAEMCADSFTWMTPESLGASVRKLESDGVLLSKSRLENRWDNSKFYRLDYSIIDSVLGSNFDSESESTIEAESESTIEAESESTISYIDSIETTTTDKTIENVAADADDIPTPSVEVEPEPEPKTLTDQQQWFDAICWCCGYDHRVISKKEAARVGTVASKLRKADYTLDDLRYWYTSVWSLDWRAKNSRPTPERITETIGRIHQSEETKPQTQAQRLAEMARRVHEELEAEGIVYAT